MTQAIVTTQQAALQGQAFDAEMVVDAFLAQLDCKESSRSLYGRTLKQFFAWASRTGRMINCMTRADIIAYRDGIISGYSTTDGKKRSTLTASAYLTAVRLFYAWLESMGAYPNITAGVKLPQRVKKFEREPLTGTQAKELIEDATTAGNLRDAAIIRLLLSAGLRTIEIVRANVEDVKRRSGMPVLFVQGKGHINKDTFVTLSEDCYKAIQAYLKTRSDMEPTAPLFTCESNKNMGGRMTTRSISRIAKTHLESIGLDGREYTAHSLRHSFACFRLQQTGDYSIVQKEMRHASPATTQIYTYHLDEQRKIEAARKYNIDEIFR